MAKNTFLVPPSLPLEHAALTEPLACVLHGMDETGAQAGDKMVVIGAGPIGLMFIHTAALNNIEVIAVVKHTEQVQLARSLWRASRCANYDDTEDVIAAVRALTPQGRGADSVVEAVATAGDLAVGGGHGAQGWRGQFFRWMRCRDSSGAGYQSPALQQSDAARELPSSSICVPTRLRLDCDRRRFESSKFLTGRASLEELVPVFRRFMHRNNDIKIAIHPGEGFNDG